MVHITEFEDMLLEVNSKIDSGLISSNRLYDKVHSVRYQTVFIVDENRRLLGVIDIKNATAFLSSPQVKILDKMITSPRYITTESNDQEAISIFQQRPSINVLPILNKDKKIMSLLARCVEAEYELPFSLADVKSTFLAHNEDTEDSWHYRSYEFNYGKLDARKYLLRYINSNFSKDVKILDVACGSGLMSFYLAKLGFNNLSGFDNSSNLISIANTLAQSRNLKINFYTGDVFSPEKDYSSYDVAIFCGLVGCAYGFVNAFNDVTPTHDMVDRLLSLYKLNEGAHVFMDIYDDLSNYSYDRSKPIYQTAKFEDLMPVFEKHGYDVVDKCYDSDYKIKVLYILKSSR